MCLLSWNYIIVIPSSIVNNIVDDINEFAAGNEKITESIDSALKTANNDLSQYIVNSKSLSRKHNLIFQKLWLINP